MLTGALFRVLKNTGALFAGATVRMVFSFAFVIYAARYLGVEGFGKFALAHHYFELFLSLSTTGLSLMLTREIAKNKELINHILISSIVLVFGLSLGSGLILLVVGNVFDYASDTKMAISLVALALLPATISQIFQAVFVAFEQAEYVTYGTSLESGLRAGLGLLALAMGYGLLALIIVLIVAQICQLVFYLYFLGRKKLTIHWSLEWAIFKKLLRDWRVFALETWVSNIYANLDVVVLSIFHAEAAVGTYVAAVKVLRLGVIAAESYTNAVFPYMSRLFEESIDGFRRVSEESLKYMLAFILPLVVAGTIFADRAIIMLYTDRYAGAIPILRILMWVLLLRFLNPFLSRTLFARGEQIKSLRVAMLKVLFFVAIAFWMIPLWDSIGAAWARLAASLVAFSLYFAAVVPSYIVRQTLVGLGRPFVAAGSLAIFLWTLRHSQLLLLLVCGIGLYILLLFLLRIVTSDELGTFARSLKNS